MAVEKEKVHEEQIRERKPRRMPELWQVVVECRDEAEQREVFERMRAEGRKVRAMVL